MLLDDERHVIKWLSQYGALTKTQVIRLLRDKTPETAEKILRNLKREHQISDVAGGYYLALDGLCKPDQRTILAVWVLLRFIDYVDPMAHYPAVYPSQIFFLKENTGYEIVVLYDGEQHLTGDDTDGTELQVAQPVILEVQLGPQWAGVEFQLKTDAGLYPGTIAVGQDGILRTELGNSGSYVLSCLTLNAAVPAPGDIPSPDVTQQEQEPLTTGSTENADAASQNVQEQDSGRPTVGGIPVMHIILFGGGLLLAAGSLVAMRFIRNRRPSERSPYDPDDEDDDEDEYEY